MPNPGGYSKLFVISDMQRRYVESPNNAIKLTVLYRDFVDGPPAWETPLFRYEFEECLLEAFPTVKILRLGNTNSRTKYVIGIALRSNGEQNAAQESS